MGYPPIRYIGILEPTKIKVTALFNLTQHLIDINCRYGSRVLHSASNGRQLSRRIAY